MQYTTNYGFSKPEYNDQLDIHVINGNMDEADDELHGLSGLIGIVQHTDTATMDIPEGRYVVWKGNLYTASSDIENGDTLSLSNLTAVTGGGIQDAKEKRAQIARTRGAEVRALTVGWTAVSVVSNKYVRATSATFASAITDALDGKHFGGFSGFKCDTGYIITALYDEATNSGSILWYSPDKSDRPTGVQIMFIAI